MKYAVESPRLIFLFGKAVAFLVILFVTTIAEANVAVPWGDEPNWSYASNDNSAFAIIPEPSTWAALILGASILMLRSRRRRA